HPSPRERGRATPPRCGRTSAGWARIQRVERRRRTRVGVARAGGRESLTLRARAPRHWETLLERQKRLLDRTPGKDSEARGDGEYRGGVHHVNREARRAAPGGQPT